MIGAMIGARWTCEREREREVSSALTAPRAVASGSGTVDGGPGAGGPRPVAHASGLKIAPSLEACIGKTNFDVAPQVETDPHGQGELLGVGFHVAGVPDLVRIDRFTMAGVAIAGQPVTDITLTSHTLAGVSAGQPIAGAGWSGATFHGALHCTSSAYAGVTIPTTVRIVEATQRMVEQVDRPTEPSETKTLRWIYRLEIDLDANHHHLPGCAGQIDQHAIPILGHWNAAGAYVPDTTELSFACVQAGAPLCMRWGGSDEPAQLATSSYEGCARMVRADYCGTGHAHTKEGTLVAPLAKGDDGSTGNDPRHFEAAWDRNGAVCRGHVRWPDNDEACPGKYAKCETWAEIDPAVREHVFVNGSCTDPGHAPSGVCQDYAVKPAGKTNARGGGGRAATRQR